MENIKELIQEIHDKVYDEGVKKGMEIMKESKEKNHKFKKGDEFVIRIAECHTHWADGNYPISLYRIEGFATLVFDDKGLERLEQYDSKKGLKEAYNRLDEGVCDICEYQHDKCHKECDKNGWEFETYKKWLKEQIGVEE